MKLSAELELAIEASKKAAEIVKAGFGNIKKVTVKGEKGYVTEIDKQSEKVILDVLQRDSTHSIYSEEAGKISGESQGEWIIDPLDGTTNFVHGIPLFSTSVALMTDNEVTIGVITNPLTGDVFYAEKGKGAYVNGVRIAVSATPQLKGSLVYPNSGYDDTSKQNLAEIVNRLTTLVTLRKFGTTALELTFVASGKVDAFVCSGDEIYDYAAGVLIVAEAGGRVTDWNGAKWNRENNFICASNGKIHEELLRKVNGIQT